jgi:hypothetical protein
MRETLVLAAVALVATTGCATAYSSARLATLGEAARAPEIFGDIEQREFGKRVQVKLPAELVVAEVRAQNHGDYREPKADKRSVQLTEALAEDRPTFASVEPLFVDSWSAKYGDLRSAAARHHSDLMLVTSMTERAENNNGPLVALNLLVLPYFLVPSETRDLALHVRCAVVDVRNDLVYATFEDHREERIHASGSGMSDAMESAFDRLYADTLAKMKTRVAERLKQLEATP